jgi:hypothetical protein
MLGWTQEKENPNYIEKEKERLWILAGNWRQFEYYNRMFRELGFYPIYLSEVRKIRGVRGEKFIRVGTWHEKRTRELDEIMAVLNFNDFTEMRHEIIEKEEEERRQWYARHVHCPDIPDIEYHNDIKPIIGIDKATIWGQKEMKRPEVPEEFIKAEEMTI